MFSRQPDITVAPFICRRVTQRTYDWASKLRAIISLFDTACGYEEMLVAPAPALSSARDPCIELWSVRGFANAAPSTPLGRELGMPSRLSKSSFQVPECSSPLRILARTATSQHSSAYPLTVFQRIRKEKKTCNCLCCSSTANAMVRGILGSGLPSIFNLCPCDRTVSGNLYAEIRLCARRRLAGTALEQLTSHVRASNPGEDN